MRSPNHYYYTGGSSLFKVFRLGIRLAIFVVAPLVLLSLGRTEGLFPRLKTPNMRKTPMKSEFFAGHLFCYPFMVGAEGFEPSALGFGVAV